MNIILIVILCLTALMCGLFYLFYRKVTYFEGTIKAFIQPVDDKTPSQLAKTTEIISDMIARSIMAQAKTFMMGLQSGQNRAETAIKGDITEDMINQSSNPLGAILSSFPAVKKSLRRNPQLLDLAMGYLGSKMQGKGNNGDKPVASGQVKFKL
jgi:hypothetical protein